MATRQLTLPGETVKKSNALARCSWPVKSVYEPRLVALVASRVTVDDEDLKVFEIPVEELFREEGGPVHHLVKEMAVALMSRVIIIQDGDKQSVYNVFSKCQYDRKQRVITVRFDPDLKPHYLALKGHFTQYSIMEFLLLPSVYSQRLFEILKSWSSLPEVTINLVDLFAQLAVPESHRSDFAAFRRRVLEKAHTDIHKHTSLKFEWHPIKKGRAVNAIRFTFGGRAAQVRDEKVQAGREDKNKLLLRAVACFKRGDCAPKPKSKVCELCERLVKVS